MLEPAAKARRGFSRIRAAPPELAYGVHVPEAGGGLPIRLQVLGGLHAFRNDVPLAWVPAQHISSALLVFLVSTDGKLFLLRPLNRRPDWPSIHVRTHWLEEITAKMK